MKVYFDNAATTPMAPEVLEAMMPYLSEHFGNPSSTHSFGRKTKSAIETARKSIAKQLNCSPMEICFSSGGTEADNTAIRGAITQLGVKHIISAPTEHHAVLHTVEGCAARGEVRLSMVRLTAKGHVDTDHLRSLLESAPEKTLVTLMHANNEIGTMIDIDEISAICHQYAALFHSDTVQTMGHFPFDLAKTKIHFLVGAAHKFHGPKGVGFLYINREVHLEPLIYGGSQERNMRAGTENLYGIVGMAKALELACAHMESHRKHIEALKDYMKSRLLAAFPDVKVNGCEERALYTVLNVSLPQTPQADMLLFLLDIDGIAVSSGSACSSGSNQGSHVLRAIADEHMAPAGPSLRFSFSRYNAKKEVDYVVDALMKHFVGSGVKV
jgi:cysteine desulfurase